MPAQPPPTARVTKGRLNQAPCPHCGKFNDLSEIAAMTADGFSEHGHGSLPGARVSCDHCGRFFVVTKVESVKIVTLQQTSGQRPAEPGAPRVPVQEQKRPGFFERLLGPGKR